MFEILFLFFRYDIFSPQQWTHFCMAYKREGGFLLAVKVKSNIKKLKKILIFIRETGRFCDQHQSRGPPPEKREDRPRFPEQVVPRRLPTRRWVVHSAWGKIYRLQPVGQVRDSPTTSRIYVCVEFFALFSKGPREERTRRLD